MRSRACVVPSAGSMPSKTQVSIADQKRPSECTWVGDASRP